MLFRISTVSSGVVGSTRTFWNLLSRAPSFSIYCRYSSSVVAPIHWISPLARAGLNIFEASSEPDAFPAPTIVWISSIKRMILWFFSSSFRTAFILSSNCPLYLVPATSEARSSETSRLLNNARETFLWTIRSASPSAMADFPTPGSPIRTGLFFFLRDSTWAIRSNSFWRPTMGSSLPSSAALVISRPKLSRTGVFDLVSEVFFGVPPKPLPASSGSSSSSSLGIMSLGSKGFSSKLFETIARTSSFATSYEMPRFWNDFVTRLFSSFKIASNRCSVPISSLLNHFASR